MLVADKEDVMPAIGLTGRLVKDKGPLFIEVIKKVIAMSMGLRNGAVFCPSIPFP